MRQGDSNWFIWVAVVLIGLALYWTFVSFGTSEGGTSTPITTVEP